MYVSLSSNIGIPCPLLPESSLYLVSENTKTYVNLLRKMHELLAYLGISNERKQLLKRRYVNI